MNNNGSNFYPDGTPTWNPTMINYNSEINVNNNINTINTNYNILCNNITIDVVNKVILIVSGNYYTNIEIKKIINYNININILTINTIDRSPYIINFIDNFNLLSFENRLYSVMNNNSDPGCI